MYSWNKHGIITLLLCLIFSVPMLGCKTASMLFATPTPTYTQTATPTNTPTPSPSPTSTVTPSPTMTWTATPTRTATPTITNTPTVTPVAYLTWPVVQSNDFSLDTGSWWIGEDNSEYATTNTRIVNGEYQWKVTAKKGVTWRITSNLNVTDFDLAVDARQVTGPTTAEYGLIFRDSQNGFYFFAVGNSYYSVAYSMRNEWTILIARTVVPGLSTESKNRLRVIGEGKHFMFFINEKLVSELDDDHLTSGQLGLAVGLFQAGDRASFAFDNYEVHAPSP